MATYCTTCGSTNEATHKFCGRCGSIVEDEIKERTKSLTEYTKDREKVRQGCFKPKNKVATATGTQKLSKEKQGRTVRIQVGLANRDAFGELSIIRGKKQSLKILDSCSAEDLKKEAIEKWANFDQTFCSMEEYKLLYPDMKEVHFIPGKEETLFQLRKYKEELAKPFSLIILYLITWTDFYHIVPNVDSPDLNYLSDPGSPLVPKTYIQDALFKEIFPEELHEQNDQPCSSSYGTRSVNQSVANGKILKQEEKASEGKRVFLSLVNKPV